mmetsp:Transcript_46181/g.91018  ORF Transcript_46181/g.91018 Transcript_46181/m.91018 type:complete len:493 (+) Transcript_46181:919-2397(+)
MGCPPAELAYLHSGALCLWRFREKTFVSTSLLCKSADGKRHLLGYPIYILPSFDTAGCEDARERESREVVTKLRQAFRRILLGRPRAGDAFASVSSAASDSHPGRSTAPSWQEITQRGWITDVNVRMAGYLAPQNTAKPVLLLNVVVDTDFVRDSSPPPLAVGSRSQSPSCSLEVLEDALILPLQEYIRSCGESCGITVRKKRRDKKGEKSFRVVMWGEDPAHSELAFLVQLARSARSQTPEGQGTVGGSIVLQLKLTLADDNVRVLDVLEAKAEDLMLRLSSILKDFRNPSPTAVASADLSLSAPSTPPPSIAPAPDAYIACTRSVWSGKLDADRCTRLLWRDRPVFKKRSSQEPLGPQKGLSGSMPSRSDEPSAHSDPKAIFRGVVGLELRYQRSLEERAQLTVSGGSVSFSREDGAAPDPENGKQKREGEPQEMQNKVDLSNLPWLERRSRVDGASFFLPLHSPASAHLDPEIPASHAVKVETDVHPQK